jgi:PAS domain S-box-containing protein
VNINLNFHSWLAKRYSLIFIICVLHFLTFGIAFYIGYKTYSEKKIRVLKSDNIAAQLLSSLITENQKAALGALQACAGEPRFVGAVEERDLAGVLPYLARLKENNNEIDWPFVTDKYGVVFANYPVDKTSLDRNLSYRDWYKGVSWNWKPYASNVFRLIAGEKELAVALCTPIFSRQGGVAGILATSQRVAFLRNIMESVPLEDNYTGVTLIDQTGQIIYSNKFPYEKKVAGYPHYAIIKKAAREGRSFLETKDQQEGGRKNYITIAPLNNLDWTVVVERNNRDMLRAEFGNFLTTALFALLFAGIISIFFVYTKKSFDLGETKELLDMEKSLREKEARFKELFEHMSSAVAIYESKNNGNDFIFKDFNSAAEKIENISRERLTGNSVLEMFPAVKDFGLFEVFQRVYNSGNPEIHPVTFYKDQRISGWRENYVCRLSSGEIVAIYDDITERKQAEEVQKNEKDTLFKILENDPSGISVIGRNGTYIYVNPEFKTITGYTLSDVPTGREWFQKAYPDHEYRKKVMEFWKKDSKEEGKGADAEFTVTCRDGSLKNIGFRTTYLKDMSITIMEDITTRKQAENLLKESEERYRTLTEKSMVGVYLLQENAFRYVNHAFALIHGLKPSEMIDKSGPMDFVHPDERDVIIKSINKRTRGHRVKSAKVAFRIIRKDGEIRHVEIFGARTMHNGTPAILGTLLDVTAEYVNENETLFSNI